MMTKMIALAAALMTMMLIGSIIEGLMAWPVALAGAAVCAVVAGLEGSKV